MTPDRTKTKDEKTGPLHRVAGAALRLTITLAVAAVAVLAIGLGSQELNRRAEALPAPDPAPAMPVTIKPIELASGYRITRSFVGQIEAKRTAVASFELSGQLNAILIDEGDTVSAGQPLATLDTRLLEAGRKQLEASKDALEAQLQFAKLTVARQSTLSDRGFASQAALDEALSRSDELSARITELDAALASNAIQTAKSQIFAPFAGRITERLVDGGESLSPGQAVLEIVEEGAPRFRVGLPIDLKKEDLAAATVDLDGTQYELTLITLRPDIDPVTRTRTALFEIQGAAGVTFGQTARLSVQDEVQKDGLWIPVTTLKEGLRGQWTVLVVDAENIVREATVQVLHTKGDDVFVWGAFPDGVRLIETGPHRVSVGQIVDPRTAS